MSPQALRDPQPLLEVENVTVNLSGLRLVDQVSFQLRMHDRLMIVGPNGAGKSTLLNAIAQSAPYGGEIRLGGQNINRFSTRQLARQLGYFSQHNQSFYGFTVQEVVELGRYAYTGKGGVSPGENQRLVNQALGLTGLVGQRHQALSTLSGGELQRAFLAQTLAQDPQVLLLDEPTNHLDIQCQKELLELIHNWASQKKRALVAVVHDLSLARLYGTHILLMDQGRSVAWGVKEQVLTAENLQKVYKMDVYGWMARLYQPWQR